MVKVFREEPLFVKLRRKAEDFPDWYHLKLPQGRYKVNAPLEHRLICKEATVMPECNASDLYPRNYTADASQDSGRITRWKPKRVHPSSTPNNMGYSVQRQLASTVIVNNDRHGFGYKCKTGENISTYTNVPLVNVSPASTSTGALATIVVQEYNSGRAHGVPQAETLVAQVEITNAGTGYVPGAQLMIPHGIQYEWSNAVNSTQRNGVPIKSIDVDASLVAQETTFAFDSSTNLCLNCHPNIPISPSDVIPIGIMSTPSIPFLNALSNSNPFDTTVTIYIRDHGFTSGQFVTYSALTLADGTLSSIGGLTDDTSYEIDSVTTHSITLTGLSAALSNCPDVGFHSFRLQNTAVGDASTKTFQGYAHLPLNLDAGSDRRVEHAVSMPNHGFETGDVIKLSVDNHDPSASAFDPYWSPHNSNLVVRKVDNDSFYLEQPGFKKKYDALTNPAPYLQSLSIHQVFPLNWALRSAGHKITATAMWEAGTTNYFFTKVGTSVVASNLAGDAALVDGQSVMYQTEADALTNFTAGTTYYVKLLNGKLQLYTTPTTDEVPLYILNEDATKLQNDTHEIVVEKFGKFYVSGGVLFTEGESVTFSGTQDGLVAGSYTVKLLDEHHFHLEVGSETVFLNNANGSGTFTAAAFSDAIRGKHDFQDGDRVRYTHAGTNIVGLQKDKVYYVTLATDNKFSLTKRHAHPPITLAAGTGTHTFAPFVGEPEVIDVMDVTDDVTPSTSLLETTSEVRKNLGGPHNHLYLEATSAKAVSTMHANMYGAPEDEEMCTSSTKFAKLTFESSGYNFGTVVTDAEFDTVRHIVGSPCQWFCNREDSAYAFPLQFNDQLSLHLRAADAEGHGIRELAVEGGVFAPDTMVEVTIALVYQVYMQDVELPQHPKEGFLGYYRNAITEPLSNI